MKLLKKIILFIFLLILAFIINLLFTTGFFRTIEPKFQGEMLQKISLPGAEDITISTIDSFAIVSSTDRGVFPPQAEEYGGLYLLELKTQNFELKHLTADFKGSFAPHGVSIYRRDSSYILMTINHTPLGHSIEVFNLKDNILKHVKTLTHPSMVSPNDLVLIDEKRFYFTNDHKYTKGLGRFLEDYGGLSVSNVIYFDGENYSEAADGIAYANGINFDVQRDLLFVASPRKFLIKVYKKNDDGILNFIENIDCKTGPDNIEFDTQGNLWIGAHPNLLRFASYAKGKTPSSPSEIIKVDYREKGDYTVETIYLESGSTMSASSVAAPFSNLIITGNVMDDEFLVLKSNP